MIWHVLLDDAGVAVVEGHGAAGRADELGRPLDHAVTLALGRGNNLAGSRDLEALFGAALGLHLGHLALHILDFTQISPREPAKCRRDAKHRKPPRHAPPGGSNERGYRGEGQGRQGCQRSCTLLVELSR